jgi:hypothetical protein
MGDLRCHQRWLENPPLILFRDVPIQTSIYKLVGGIPTPLKNMKVSWDDDIPNIWKVIKFHGSKPPTSKGFSHSNHHLQRSIQLAMFPGAPNLQVTMSFHGFPPFEVWMIEIAN